MGFEPAQLSQLTDLKVWLSVLSFLGSVSIVSSYFVFKDLRSIAFRLVFFMSSCDIGYSVANFFGNPEYGFFCSAQAVMLSFFSVSSMMWTACIAYTLQQAIFGENYHPEDIEKKLPRYHCFSWTIAIIVTILPAFSDSYGEAGGWCWIQRGGIHTTWRFFCFYLPMWSTIAYHCWVYSRIYKRLKSLEAESEFDDNRSRMMIRIKYYPMILIVCYFFASVNRIAQIFGEPVFSLAVLQIVGTSVRGFVNSLVYGMNPLVRAALADFLASKGCLCFGDRIRHHRVIEIDDSGEGISIEDSASANALFKVDSEDDDDDDDDDDDSVLGDDAMVQVNLNQSD